MQRQEKEKAVQTSLASWRRLCSRGMRWIKFVSVERRSTTVFRGCQRSRLRWNSTARYKSRSWGGRKMVGKETRRKKRKKKSEKVKPRAVSWRWGHFSMCQSRAQISQTPWHNQQRIACSSAGARWLGERLKQEHRWETKNTLLNEKMFKPGKPVASAKILEDTLWNAIAFVQWLNISTKAAK